MTAELIRVAPAEWPGLAGFIVEHNRRADGGVHCLHAQQGNDLASHTAELAALASDAAAFWVLEDGGALLAVVGCEIDLALQRAWLRGPLCADPRAAEVLLRTVGPTLETALPAVRQFDAFPALDSKPLNAWLGSAGYEALQVQTLLRAPIDAPASVDVASARRATPSDLASALALHQTLFPSAYITETEFVRGLGESDCALFVASLNDDGPSGYLFVRDAPIDHEVYIDYLGVDTRQQRCGLGRALLGAASRWGTHRGRDHVALTVREDRRSAHALYRQSGFIEVSSGRHWRKTVATPVSADPREHG
ncbi:MAG: N-acetyltransferase [Caldimonas sp.]